MDKNESNWSEFTSTQGAVVTDCQNVFCIFTFALFCLTVALIVVLNSVCLVVLRRVRGVQETTKMFMMSLTLSDLCFGIFYGSASLLYFVSTWIISGPLCKVLPYVIATLITINALSMVLLTIDRFLAITYSLHYPRLMTLKRSKVMITLVWMVTLIVYSAWYCLYKSELEMIKEIHAFYCVKQDFLRYILISISGVSLGTILTLYAYIHSESCLTSGTTHRCSEYPR